MCYHQCNDQRRWQRSATAVYLCANPALFKLKEVLTRNGVAVTIIAKKLLINLCHAGLQENPLSPSCFIITSKLRLLFFYFLASDFVKVFMFRVFLNKHADSPTKPHRREIVQAC